MFAHFAKHRTRYLSFFVVAILVSIITYSLYTTKAQTTPTFVEDIRPVGSGYVELTMAISGGAGYPTQPSDVLFDASGSLLVLDGGSDRVLKFSPEGVETTIIPPLPFGSGAGQITGSVMKFDLDSAGNIYITTTNDKVLKFDSSGNFLLEFGSTGSGPGQFSIPDGIGVDASDNVYVADWNNARVQKFDSSGNYLSSFGTRGSGDGQFQVPTGLTVDSLGNIYVLDNSSMRVQKFDSSGAFLLKFGAAGTGDGQFSSLNGIEVDSTGMIYVSDQTGHKVQKFDSTGAFVAQVGSYALSGIGTLNGPNGIAVDALDKVYIADSSSNSVQVFDSSSVSTTEYAPYGRRTTELNSPSGVDVDGSGNIYVTDAGWDKVWKFDSAGNIVTTFGSTGSGDGQLNGPEGIFVDALGNSYVLDTGNSRIQKFDSNGTFLMKFGTAGTGDGQFDAPSALTVDSDSNIYVLDNGNGRVQKFNSNGDYLMQFGSPGTANGQFGYSEGIVVDASGYIYVADSDNHRIQKFDSSGNYVSQFGSYGTGDGQFDYPLTITIDALGNMYVYDYGNVRAIKFDSDGNYVSTFGSIGVGNGLFWSVEGMTIDAAGKIYFADADRISIWQGEAVSAVPVISDVSANPSSSGATITWSTDIAGSSFVEFGPSTNYGSSTAEIDTSPRVTSHTVTITDLVPCSLFNYRVKSVGATPGTASSTNATFTTSGCTGAASAIATSTTIASVVSTSTMTVSTLTISVPPEFATSTAATTTFQALKLEPVAFFASSSYPVGVRVVGTNVYHLNALTDATTTITSFTSPVTVTLAYEPNDLAGINSATLTIYRYDGAVWHALSACSHDTIARTVTCTTSNFSEFALFGAPDTSTVTYGASGFRQADGSLSSTPPADASVREPVMPIVDTPVPTATTSASTSLPVEIPRTREESKPTTVVVKNTPSPLRQIPEQPLADESPKDSYVGVLVNKTEKTIESTGTPPVAEPIQISQDDVAIGTIDTEPAPKMNLLSAVVEKISLFTLLLKDLFSWKR